MTITDLPTMLTTLPNLISLTRALAILPIALCLQHNLRLSATIIFLLAIMTDALDGYIARKTNAISDSGKIIDPAADAILLTGVMTCLYNQTQLPLWFIMFILLRYLSIIFAQAIYLNYANNTPQANTTGKISICFLMLLISILLAIPKPTPAQHQWINWLFNTNLMLLLASSLDYYKQAWKSTSKQKQAAHITKEHTQ